MKLETIKLWRRVQHIHKDAFKNCLSFQEFNGSYVSHFHDYAIADCTNLCEVKLDIDNIFQITANMFFGCICPMLRLTFADDMEALLSQLPNNSLYWLTEDPQFPEGRQTALKLPLALANTTKSSTRVNLLS